MVHIHTVWVCDMTSHIVHICDSSSTALGDTFHCFLSLIDGIARCIYCTSVDRVTWRGTYESLHLQYFVQELVVSIRRIFVMHLEMKQFPNRSESLFASRFMFILLRTIHAYHHVKPPSSVERGNAKPCNKTLRCCPPSLCLTRTIKTFPTTLTVLLELPSQLIRPSVLYHFAQNIDRV